MDHLPLPTEDLANPPLQIHLVCNDRFCYDDLGFLTYPNRAGVDLEEVAERRLMDIDHLAPFVQAWLWFGLLGELLYVGSRPNRDQKITSCASFIRETLDAKRVLSMADIYTYVSKMGKRNKTIRQDDFYLDRFSSCIKTANDAIHKIMTSKRCRSDMDQTKEFGDLPTFYTIVISVQILIETLDACRHILLPSASIRLEEQQSSTLHFELMNMRLREAGWCPYEVVHLPQSFRLRHYLSFMRPADFQGHGSHVSCSEVRCSKEISQKASIKPQHVTPNCQCQLQTVDTSRIADILAASRIPLLTFAKNAAGGARELKVLETPCSQGRHPAFVAISHVRRAGLGNTKDNALPTCQLSRMQELARCASTASDAPPFWIDVMCVPISGAYHSESIRRIRWVYAKAEKVLVLDPSLYTHHVGSCEEALIRIRYSLWKRRLWTLQEGVLAKQLCFKFWDEIVALDELLEQYESSCSFPLLQRQNFDALPINGYLPEILTLLDDDIKTFKKLRRTVPELTEGIDYKKLCRALRLGYLGTPRYRYFIEDDELAPMAEVLRTLAGVYLNPPGMPLQASLRTTEQVLAGLKVVQGIEAFQEQES